jgi:hypothetical protein
VKVSNLKASTCVGGGLELEVEVQESKVKALTKVQRRVARSKRMGPCRGQKRTRISAENGGRDSKGQSTSLQKRRSLPSHPLRRPVLTRPVEQTE